MSYKPGEMALTTEPRVGAPATIVMRNDTSAAVVTRVTASNIWVRHVETTNERTDNPGEPWPIRIADGITDRPIGDERRFTRNDQTGRHGPQARGEVYVRIGYSMQRRDYRY